jgi:EAL domain-containing protein (putative c-di-GMP-specific phosphodiesterase class I)
LIGVFCQRTAQLSEPLDMQENATARNDSGSMHGPLMEFLSRAPIGVLQAALDGTIETVNPMAAGLLAPLSSSGQLDNLFVALAEAAPQVRQMVAAFDQASGTVCESIRVPLAGRANSAVPQILSLSVFKLDAVRLMATVSAVVAEPAVSERSSRRGAMEGELRQAIAENKLLVKYQPVVGLREEGSGFSAVDRGAGVEALVRWNHRIRGAVSPLEFLGVAEECGLIGALGDFVLRTACNQFVRWKNDLGARAPKFLAVNLSRGQFTQAGFVASVRDILESSGMVPGELQLEVHESWAAKDEVVQAGLLELKALGLMLALDNYGSGYSSLTSLHLLKVDVIKIDRSFVNQAVASEHHRVLIDATVRVATSLGMSTAAEGIETEAQLSVVRQLGCERGQGYFFSEAISAPNLVQFLTSE